MAFLFLFLGSPGGLLFEYYLLHQGRNSEVERLARVLSPRRDLSLDEKKEERYDPLKVFQNNVSQFWFYAACTLYKLNQKCSLPLMHFYDAAGIPGPFASWSPTDCRDGWSSCGSYLRRKKEGNAPLLLCRGGGDGRD